MTKPAVLQPPFHVESRSSAPDPDPVDLSRGARHFGIRPEAVFIESEILDDYAEPDAALGQNVVGAILSVLGCQLAVNSGGVPDESTTVCLLRRDDARLVEVDIQICRMRRLESNCLLLRKTSERSLEVQLD